jgi:hypothetical protein
VDVEADTAESVGSGPVLVPVPEVPVGMASLVCGTSIGVMVLDEANPEVAGCTLLTLNTSGVGGIGSTSVA